MAIGGHKVQKLWKEHLRIDKAWRELAGNYWRDFIHEAKEKGFQFKFVDQRREIEVIKEDKKIMSLFFMKGMLKEDFNIRYTILLEDKKPEKESD